MRWTRRKFRYLLKVFGIINLLLILTLVCTVFVKYVLNKNVDMLIIIESFLFLLWIIADILIIAIYKDWQVKETRFGLMGTFVRVTVGIAAIFKVLYIVVQYLPLPG